jgi:hypothetical protein
MPINVGAGIDAPDLSSPLQALPNIRWAGEQTRPTQIYDDFWKQSSGYHAPSSYDVMAQEMGPNRPGSLSYGATLEQQQNLWDPRNYTLAQTPAPPLTLTQQSVQATAVPGKIKSGQLTLDMVHPLDFPQQLTGSFVGQATPAVGDGGWLADPARFLAERNIEPLGNLPARLFDYALTPISLIANHVTGGGVPQATDASGLVKYAFQRDARYWQWVQDPGTTDDALAKQAWATAQMYSPGYQNQDFEKALADQFKKDRDITLGLSSGDDGIDYTALSMLQKYLSIAKDQNVPIADVLSFAGLSTDQAASALFQSHGSSSLYTDVGMAKTPILSGNGIAGIPIVGDIWRTIAPNGPSQETKDAWASLTMQQRLTLLGSAGATNSSAFLLATLPVFSGVGQIAAFGARAAEAADFGRAVTMGARTAGLTANVGGRVVGGADVFSGIGAGAARGSWEGIALSHTGTQVAGFAYDVYAGGLNLAAQTMKVGLGIAGANWTAEAFVPGWTDFLGREIDQSQPVSHSPFAAAVNTFGYFVSPQEVLGSYLGYATRPIRGPISNIMGGITSEIPMDRFGLGGQQFRVSMNRRFTNLATGEQMPAALLDDSAKSVILSETMNKIRSDQVYGWQAGIHSVEPTGWAEFDNLPLADKINFATEHLLTLERELPRIVENRLQISNLARQRLGTLADATARDSRNAMRDFSREWEDDVARRYVNQYGSGFFSARVEGPYGIPALQKFIEDSATRMGYSIDMAGITRDVNGLTGRFGDRLAAWETYARRVYQTEFHANNATLQEVMKSPLADGTPSDEAGRLNMVRQNHLFYDLASDFSEQLKSYKTAEDPAVAEAAARDRAWALIQATEELQGWWAGKRVVDRSTGEALPKTRENIPLSELDKWLDEALPLLMHRRGLPPIESSTSTEAINAFHRKLESEGQWTLAFKPEYALDPGSAFGTGAAADVRPTFVSFHRMDDGSFMQSPYVEYPMSSSEQVDLGGQGYIASRLDSLTRAWRSWRISEFQRGLLHRNLSRYEGVTSIGMDKFFADVVDLARTERFGAGPVSVHMTSQGVGAFAGISRDLGSSAIREKVVKLAEQTFGKGPYRNLQTGALEEINWPKVLQNSFRQSWRLNLTAGITGKLKTLPHGIGETAILASDFAVPLMRFSLSPVFRVGEYIESAMANAGRATFNLDPITAPLFTRGALSKSHGVMASEAGSGADPMAQALDAGGSTQPRGQDLQFLSRSMPPQEAMAREQATAGRWQGVDVPGSENMPGAPASYQRLADAHVELQRAEYELANVDPADLTAGFFGERASSRTEGTRHDTMAPRDLRALAGRARAEDVKAAKTGQPQEGLYDFTVSRPVSAEEYTSAAVGMENAFDRWMNARAEYESAMAGVPGGAAELARQKLASMQVSYKQKFRKTTEIIDMYTSDMEWSRDRLVVAMGELPEFQPITPGFTRMYHGSPANFTAFDESRLEATSLAGPGIYTTDERALARTYNDANRPQAGREDPIVYGVDIPSDMPLVDLEGPVPTAVHDYAQAQLNELVDNMVAGLPETITHVDRNGNVHTLTRDQLRQLGEAGFTGEIVNWSNYHAQNMGRERQRVAQPLPRTPEMDAARTQAFLQAIKDVHAGRPFNHPDTGELISGWTNYRKIEMGLKRDMKKPPPPEFDLSAKPPPEGVMSEDEALAWLDGVTSLGDEAGMWNTIRQHMENPDATRDSMTDPELLGKPLTGMELYAAVRRRSGFGMRGTAGDFIAMRDMWERLGYGGASHLGGVTRGGPLGEHNVIIVFRSRNAHIVERNYPEKIDQALDREREIGALQDGIAETTAKVDQLRADLGERQLAAQPHIDAATQAIKDAEAETVQEIEDWILTRPASSLDEILDTPEAVEAAIDKAGQSFTGQAARLFKKVWSPQSYKEEASHTLAVKMMRDTIPPILKASSPKLVGLLNELGIPERHWAEFLIADRTKYQAWLDSGTKADWDQMLAQIEIARGESPAAAAELDAFTESDEWSVISDLFRVNAKTAQSAAFGVHFFSAYRSSFGRSLNHPLLGMYPAAWAYKAAKEWYRFLYDNRMFGGGALHLGMSPAVALAKISDAQDQGLQTFPAADLLKFLGEGPLGSTFFIANLLLPGDWSSLPFPLSRSIRLLMRGDWNPADHITQNLFGGVGGQSGAGLGVVRDLRLMTESGTELMDLWNQPMSSTEAKFNRIATTEARGFAPTPSDWNKIVSYGP